MDNKEQALAWFETAIEAMNNLARAATGKSCSVDDPIFQTIRACLQDDGELVAALEKIAKGEREDRNITDTQSYFEPLPAHMLRMIAKEALAKHRSKVTK